MLSAQNVDSTRSFHPVSGWVVQRQGVQPAAAGLGTVRVFAKDQEIYGEGEAVTHFHEVRSGAVRIAALLRDGHRQIVSFAFPGDVIGLETGATHRFSEEALAPTTLVVCRLGCLSGELPAARHWSEEVTAAMMRSHQRVQDHVVLLGRRSARERIAAFLCSMSERLGAETFDLPMSRSDVADHLGLTIESVSRNLTSLAAEGIIEAPCGRRTISVQYKRALVQRAA